MQKLDEFMFAMLSGFAWAIALQATDDRWAFFMIAVAMTAFALFMPAIGGAAGRRGTKDAERFVRWLDNRRR